MTLVATFIIVLGSAAGVRAQDAALVGRVTDSTDAVLPGVTVTAVHVDTGNTFSAVTDPDGTYRLSALRTGTYRISVELSGFTTLRRENIELLLGQRAVLDFQMLPADFDQVITVTAAAPLLDLTQSSLGGNVDTRQMQELPINGRNWLELSMLAPGLRVNAVTDAPVPVGGVGTNFQINQYMAGVFQLNLDGQQVSDTQNYAIVGQPRFSRDAIAELEVLSSRFDATQGRARTLQVNAISKAGTNRLLGSLSGYFRDDSLNAADAVARRVLPYSNQQVSGTVGGPIRKDRIHFFANYEGEREPLTFVRANPYPQFNAVPIDSTVTQKLAGGRVDTELSRQTRLMVRANLWRNTVPVDPGLTGLTNHPSTTVGKRQASDQVFGSFVQAWRNSTNELKVGVTRMHAHFKPVVPDGPQIYLQGFTIGVPAFAHHGGLVLNQDTYSVRDDFTFFRSGHQVKIGGEYLLPRNYLDWGSNFNGIIFADAGPVPANIEALFPVWNDPSTWNLAALSPITSSYSQGVGEARIWCALSSSCKRSKPEYGAYVQDDWKVTDALSLNLGVRWDLALGAVANDIALPPFKPVTPEEYTNFGPRLGAAYVLPDKKTVIRGGWGKYYTGANGAQSHETFVNNVQADVAVLNDGRPNFAADPFNLAGGGRAPTLEEGRARIRNLISMYLGKIPYSYQTAVGVQRELAPSLAIQADYVWTAERGNFAPRQINLSFDPATGRNFPLSDISKRPYPMFGSVVMGQSDSYYNYHGLEVGLTKRLSHRYQLSGTYTLSGTWDYNPLPLLPGCRGPMNGLTMTCDTPFAVASDLGGEYTHSEGDQRHRAVLNGILELPLAFQVSGLYTFGSGLRYSTNYGGDLRDSGRLTLRLRPDGTIVPRNNFVGKPIHRVDLRLQRRTRLVGRATLDGLVEVFNVFNHANYGSYVTAEASPLYGQPFQNPTLAYTARMVQLGFRFTF